MAGAAGNPLRNTVSPAAWEGKGRRRGESFFNPAAWPPSSKASSLKLLFPKTLGRLRHCPAPVPPKVLERRGLGEEPRFREDFLEALSGCCEGTVPRCPTLVLPPKVLEGWGSGGGKPFLKGFPPPPEPYIPLKVLERRGLGEEPSPGKPRKRTPTAAKEPSPIVPHPCPSP